MRSTGQDLPIGKLHPVAATSANPTPEPMRERIVDVAVELFARQGYAKDGIALRHRQMPVVLERNEGG